MSVAVEDPVRHDLDLAAIERNHARIVARLPAGTKLLCSVKANAYGHGVLAVVRSLEALGVDWVATASVGDSLALRGAGLRCRILLFGGQPPEAVPLLAERDLTVTVANAQTAHALAASRLRRPSVFLKVDAGLGRLGVPLEETEALLRDTLLPAGVAVDGIYTHLPFADANGERWARAGLDRFQALVDRLRHSGIEIPLVQALSSPGLSAGLPLVGNAVCPGRLLYGLVPAAGGARSWGLDPALRSMTTQIVHLRRYTTDTRVAAGGRHSVRAGGATAVIPLGRSGGYLVDPALGPAVVHRGRRVPVISVSLEHATVDIGPFPVAIGDEVAVLGGPGPHVSLAELAEWSRLEPLEILVAFGRREDR